MEPSNPMLAALVAEAQTAWPELGLDGPGFGAYLTERLPVSAAATGESTGGSADREELVVADLYLAYGCAEGRDAAIQAFDRTYGPTVERVARRFVRSGLSVPDLKQLLWEKLYVAGAGRPPRIAEYRGRGLLEHWVRVAALRMFIDAQRAERGEANRADEAGADLMALTERADPELDFLKQRYRREFKEAFEQAVTQLEDRERNLLWHQTVVGHTLDQIAAIYHLHRATAGRHLVRARERLLSLTRQELMARLQLDGAEFESIMHLIQSRLDVTLSRVLGRDKPLHRS